VKRSKPTVTLVHVPKEVGSKITYRHYMEASDSIKKLLQHSLTTYLASIGTESNLFVIEKGSIDEWFIDITRAVDRIVTSTTSSTPIEWEGTVIGEKRDVSLLDRKLQYASKIASHLRQQIKQQLGYTW
jgi:hypothetical protein